VAGELSVGTRSCTLHMGASTASAVAGGVARGLPYGNHHKDGNQQHDAHGRQNQDGYRDAVHAVKRVLHVIMFARVVTTVGSSASSANSAQPVVGVA
jgi:hypothetical protein